MTVIDAPAVVYDPFSAAFQDDPFPVYRILRERAPVYHSEQWGFWALSRFDDVRAAARDHETFRSFQGIDIDDTAKDMSAPGFLPDVDNPRHDELRRIVQRTFLPRRIAGLEPDVRRVITGLVDRFADRGIADIAQELSWPTPYAVFFDVLGLPTTGSDREDLVGWSHGLKDREPDDPRLTPLAWRALHNTKDYLAAILTERRRHPREDLLSVLATADVPDVDGVPYAPRVIDRESEIVGLAFVLFMAGVESTSALLSSVFRELALHPEQQRMVREDPSLIPAAVEEALRFDPPLQVSGRTAIRDVTLHGTTIPAGARVFLVHGSANRDPRRYDDPDTFDITRPPQRHMAFSEGLHGCLGAPLARLEARVALEVALPRLGEFAIDGLLVRYRSTPNMHVLDALPIRFTPRRNADRIHGTDVDARVTARTDAADGVIELTLAAADGGTLPAWEPGAHVDLVLDKDCARPYSLCGDPADRRTFRLGILREPDGRGGSARIHDECVPGSRVRVRGPRNHFRLEPSPRYVFVAGGIGITPILPMIDAAERAGAEWELVYGGRTAGSMAFVDELSRHGPKVALRPQDVHGLLDLDALLGTPRADTLVYCCGPAPLLDAVEKRCAAWPAGSLHIERFAAAPLTAPVRSGPFEVELTRTGVTVTVLEGQSVLDVAERAGAPVQSSCAEGTCGTCDTPVLDGVPDHRDAVLSADERARGNCMMICVSRACSERLVLDL